MKQLSSLSLFFPSLNDAKILPYLVARAHQAAKKVTRDFEIIVVNDGSTDETSAILEELVLHYPKLTVVTHKTNRGYGAALISGFNTSTKDWVFYTDGDGQYDPMELTRLVRRVSPAIDVVNGYKGKRADNVIRTFLGWVYNGAIQRSYHPPIRDVDCDFRLIRAALLKKIRLQSRSGAICLELITKLQLASARFAEVPVTHYARLFGRSQFFQLKHLRSTFREYRNSARYRRFRGKD